MDVEYATDRITCPVILSVEGAVALNDSGCGTHKLDVLGTDALFREFGIHGFLQ